jgi:hypothetical protein
MQAERRLQASEQPCYWIEKSPYNRAEPRKLTGGGRKDGGAEGLQAVAVFLSRLSRMKLDR